LAQAIAELVYACGERIPQLAEHFERAVLKSSHRADLNQRQLSNPRERSHMLNPASVPSNVPD
jgi:hypothetical protein